MTAWEFGWTEITAAEGGPPEGTRVDTPEKKLFYHQQAQGYAAISYVTEGSTVSLPPATEWWATTGW